MKKIIALLVLLCICAPLILAYIDEQPEVIKKVMPTYPKEAKEKGHSGTGEPAWARP